nr:putative ribonuclease h protein [Quercus suber]
MGKGRIELKVAELMGVAGGEDRMESIPRSISAISPLMEIANQENLSPSKHVAARFLSCSLKRMDPALRSGQRAKDEINEGVFKLNSNGSSLGNSGKAGGGGLIQNDKGEWLKGYARNVGFSTSVFAELWALHDGLRLCIALKLPAMIIELDAKLIVDPLQKSNGHRNCIDALVSDCKTELGNIPRVQINHFYREVNKCADALARRGAMLSQDFVIFLDPPAEVSLLLSLNSVRVAYDRVISV